MHSTASNTAVQSTARSYTDTESPQHDSWDGDMQHCLKHGSGALQEVTEVYRAQHSSPSHYYAMLLEIHKFHHKVVSMRLSVCCTVLMTCAAITLQYHGSKRALLHNLSAGQGRTILLQWGCHLSVKKCNLSVMFTITFRSSGPSSEFHLKKVGYKKELNWN